MLDFGGLSRLLRDGRRRSRQLVGVQLCSWGQRGGAKGSSDVVSVLSCCSLQGVASQDGGAGREWEGGICCLRKGMWNYVEAMGVEEIYMKCSTQQSRQASI